MVYVGTIETTKRNLDLDGKTLTRMRHVEMNEKKGGSIDIAGKTLIRTNHVEMNGKTEGNTDTGGKRNATMMTIGNATVGIGIITTTQETMPTRKPSSDQGRWSIPRLKRIGPITSIIATSGRAWLATYGR